MSSSNHDGQVLFSEPLTDTGPETRQEGSRSEIPTLGPALGRAGVPTLRSGSQGQRRKAPPLPSWAIAASLLWVGMAAAYLALVGGIRLTPSAVGAIAAGVATPLCVIWLIALLQLRMIEVETITQPVRRQLAALLAPGANAESRVRRITQALAEQAEHLRNAANVALEDSSAAMNAISRQSGELRRLSGEAMLDIGKVGKTAEQTLMHLREALAQVNLQTGAERERALALVSDLEKHIREVLGQVDKLSTSYESKIERLSETSTRLEERTRVLVSISDGVENKVDQAAAGVLGDLDRLESAVAELGQRSAAIAHQLARPVESLERAAGHLDSNMRQSQEMLQNATQNLDRIGDNALSRASSLVATLSDRLSSMELVGAKLVSVGASAQADTGRYVSQLEAAAERIRTQADAGQQQLRQVLREFGSVADQSLKQSDSLAGRLREGADYLAETMAKSQQRFDTLADDIEQRAGRLRDLGKDAHGQIEEARLVLDGAQESFSSQLDQLGRVSERLSGEIERAGAGVNQLAEVTNTAADRANALLKAGDRTSETLGSIAGLLTEQRQSVEHLAQALNIQIETLTAALANQQNEIVAATGVAGQSGERMRGELQQQLAAITRATTEMAGCLDGLQGRLNDETTLLGGMADRLDGRLTSLVEMLVQETGKVDEAGALVARRHGSLSELTSVAQDKLMLLSGQISSTQSSAETALEGVTARLIALRAELGQAEQNLLNSSQQVSGEQLRLSGQSETLNRTLADTLQRLETLAGGLDSAGQAMSAQGQAAGALISQAEQQLSAAGAALIGQSQTVEMALAGAGEEVVRQQRHLAGLQQQAQAMSEALEVSRTRLEAGGQALVSTGECARRELEERAAGLASSATALQLQVRESVGSLQSAEGSFRDVKSEMVAHTDQVDGRIRQLQQDMAALQNILAGLTSQSDALAGSLAQQAVQAELASGKLQNASTVADQSTVQMMARMTELGSTAEQQQQSLVRMSDAVVAATENLRSNSERGQQGLRQTLEELAGAGQKADELIAGMIEKLRSAGTGVGSEASGAQTLLGEITEALRATASEFTERVENAEAQMTSALGNLDVFGRQLSTESINLQDNIHTLSMGAETARHELNESQNSIAAVGASVAQALAGLVSEIETLGSAGSANARQLDQLSGSIADNLATLQSAGGSVAAQQDQFIARMVSAQQSLRDMSQQVDGARGIVGQMADHAAARLAEVSVLFAQRVREGEEMVGSATGRLSALEQRVHEATSAFEQKQGSWLDATGQTLQRLAEVDDSFVRTVARNEAAQARLVAQAGQNERMIGGLTQLTEMGTATLDEQAQRLAILAQQAASDSDRLIQVAGRIEQQQTAMRHAADAAVAVLHSVEAQVTRSSEQGVSLMDAAEVKVSDVLVAMTDRLVGLSRQNDDLMAQLRNMVERFTQATGLMHESSRMLGSDINATAEQLHTRALDLTAAGQQFDRELKVRLSSLGESQHGLERYFSGFGQQLAELDTRTAGYLIDLDRRSQEAFGRLQSGADMVAAIPEQIQASEGLISAQVEAARGEISRLRSDLLEIGREVQEQVASASGSSTRLIGNLQDAGLHSRMMAEQIEQASSQMGIAAESAWQAIRSAVTDSTSGMSSLVGDLSDAETRTTGLVQLARGGVEGLLERVTEMSRLLDASLTRINYNYEQLAKGGFNALSQLTQELDSSATRLDQSTSAARQQLGTAASLIDQHQMVLEQGTGALVNRLDEVQRQLSELREGFGGLDARLEFVGPALSNQQEKLEGFLTAVDRTLNQVSALQAMSRDLAGEHLELAARVQDNESRLMNSASELEGKLGRLDTALSGAVLARLVQAAEHAQTVEGFLGRLTSQAGRLDGALVQIRQSLEHDVTALQKAESGISQVAENTAGKMLEVGTALNATLSQLQRGGQLSHAGLMQTNEETQRLVVRLEQVRALIKNMMGGISTDINEWQSDMRRKLTGIASELASPSARASIPPLPPLQQRVRVATGSVATTSAQLTTEALHAVAVDLYRLLQAEVPALRTSLTPPAARRTPMTPEDARSYTLILLEQNVQALIGHVRELYRQNLEFHQYVDRYLARFEAQYDVLSRASSGPAEANAYRISEVGRLYELLAGALARKALPVAVEAAG